MKITYGSYSEAGMTMAVYIDGLCAGAIVRDIARPGWWFYAPRGGTTPGESFQSINEVQRSLETR